MAEPDAEAPSNVAVELVAEGNCILKITSN